MNGRKLTWIISNFIFKGWHPFMKHLTFMKHLKFIRIVHILSLVLFYIGQMFRWYPSVLRSDQFLHPLRVLAYSTLNCNCLDILLGLVNFAVHSVFKWKLHNHGLQPRDNPSWISYSNGLRTVILVQGEPRYPRLVLFLTFTWIESWKITNFRTKLSWTFNL